MLTERFERAFMYAMVVHGRAERKGTKIPYMAHLLGVTSLVLQYGGTEDQAIGALLHDAAEDGGGESRLRDIERTFGPAVAAIVDGCSDTLSTTKEPWLTRKVGYISRVPNEPAFTLLVSVADKIHNVGALLADYRTEGEALWSRFNPDAGKDGTVGYYRGLVTAYKASGHCSQAVADLDALVSKLEDSVGMKGVWVPPRLAGIVRGRMGMS